MDERLPAHVEAAAILRRVEANGGFGAVLRKGDPDRGSLVLLIYERGQFHGMLERELADRIKNILDFLAAVEQDEPKRIPTIKEKLNTLLADVVGKESVDGNRLEQELIYYIDKLDITEEKVRLRSHCNYFMETLRAKDANGKKLGFISQEIGREINTMGSKANDASIQRHVVGMKEELEKVKEQLLNVL